MNRQQLKPVVCVLNPDDIYWMREHGDSKYLGNLLTPYEAKNLEQTQNVEFPEIKENVVFMLDPLEGNKYIVRTESTDADIVEKRINAIGLIVSLLGGINYRVISERKGNSDKETHVGVGVNVKVKSKVDVDSNTNVDKVASSSEEKNITAIAEFNGKYSEDNYYVAVATAQQYGLSDDPKIEFLLKMRHPDNPNFIIKDKYEVNTCKDLKENLKVAEALKTNVMNAVKVDVDVNVETSHDERYMESFEFEAEFAPVVKDPEWKRRQRKNKEGKAEKSNRWLFWVMGGIIVALAAGLIIALL